jgi:hypothetical protein
MKALIQNISREKVLLILDWCEHQFGRSQYYRKRPRLRVYRSRGASSFSERDGALFGTYAPGLISIYLGSHRSVKQLCGTVIHEYRHYMLSTREYKAISFDLVIAGWDLDRISTDHPHEKDCQEFEKTWIDVCFSALRKDLYRKKP